MWAPNFKEQSTGLSLNSYNTVALVIDVWKTNDQNRSTSSLSYSMHTLPTMQLGLSDYMQILVEQQKALYYIFTYLIHANTLKGALCKNFK